MPPLSGQSMGYKRALASDTPLQQEVIEHLCRHLLLVLRGDVVAQLRCCKALEEG